MITEIYAKSLIELGGNYLEQLKQIQETFDSSQDLQIVLKNPAISINKKLDILQSIFGTKVDDKLINFLKILCENGRFEDLNAIIGIYEKKLDENNNVKFVEILSAINLTDDYKQKIKEKLENKLNAAIHAQWLVEPEIIGGLIFKFDDTVANLSLKKKIENFSKIMK